jgi:hypothetical protein
MIRMLPPLSLHKCLAVVATVVFLAALAVVNWAVYAYRIEAPMPWIEAVCRRDANGNGARLVVVGCGNGNDTGVGDPFPCFRWEATCIATASLPDQQRPVFAFCLGATVATAIGVVAFCLYYVRRGPGGETAPLLPDVVGIRRPCQRP